MFCYLHGSSSKSQRPGSSVPTFSGVRVHLSVSLATNAFRTLELDSYVDANVDANALPGLELYLHNGIGFLTILNSIGLLAHGILDAPHYSFVVRKSLLTV